MKENHGRVDTQYSCTAQSNLNMHALTAMMQAILHFQDAAFPHRLRTAKIFFVGGKLNISLRRCTMRHKMSINKGDRNLASPKCIAICT